MFCTNRGERKVIEQERGQTFSVLEVSNSAYMVVAIRADFTPACFEKPTAKRMIAIKQGLKWWVISAFHRSG